MDSSRNIASTYEEELSSYAKNLMNKKLPVIYSLKHFSLMIDIPYKDIKYIINNRTNFYNTFYIEKNLEVYDKLKLHDLN